MNGDFRQPFGCLQNLLSHGRRIGDQPDEHLCLGVVGDDVGRVAALNLAHVQRRVPGVLVHRPVGLQQFVQESDQLVDGQSPSSG